MTVKELIEKLKTFPEDNIICCIDEGYGFEVTKVIDIEDNLNIPGCINRRERFKPRNFKEVWLG